MNWLREALKWIVSILVGVILIGVLLAIAVSGASLLFIGSIVIGCGLAVAMVASGVKEWLDDRQKRKARARQ